MAKQTIDAAYFIRDYAMNKNFCMYAAVCQSSTKVKPLFTHVIREKNVEKYYVGQW